MADLDDFFAKKDKKKGSKQKKFSTAEELAKKLEDTTKKVEPKPRKEQRTINEDNEEVTITVEQEGEDEWKSFEAEERKDYTGLKIGQLTIIEDDQSNYMDGEGNSEGHSDGEGNSENSDRRPSLAWKHVSSQAKTEVVNTIPEQEPEKPVSKVYISPALRNQMAQGPKTMGRLRNKTAPDIHSEEYFPSLAAGGKPEVVTKKKNDVGFEEVKHGGRFTRASELPGNTPVSIGNRFNSLSGDAS